MGSYDGPLARPNLESGRLNRLDNHSKFALGLSQPSVRQRSRKLTYVYLESLSLRPRSWRVVGEDPSIGVLQPKVGLIKYLSIVPYVLFISMGLGTIRIEISIIFKTQQ